MASSTRAGIIPTLRYADAKAAIAFLCGAFGFKKHRVIEGEGGTIEHAQLTLAGGMIMLGSARSSDNDALVAPPSQTGTLTQCPYVVIEEIDGHCAKAKAAGATIVTEFADQPHGDQLYAAKDPEGQLWCFGSYDSWAAEPF